MASLSAMIRSPIVTNVIVYHNYNVTDVSRHLFLSTIGSTSVSLHHRLCRPAVKTAPINMQAGCVIFTSVLYIVSALDTIM